MSGPRSYGRGAAVLSVGIGVTGLVTYTYFSLASHSLADDEYGRITLLWSAVFVVVVGALPAGRAAAVADDRRA